MQGYLKLVAGEFGIPIFALVIILVWSAFWKLLALWKAARKKHIAWFIVLALLNTIGILEILYIFVFSECYKKKTPRPRRKKRRR
jgi:methionyl-tRNA synthetase